MAYLEIREGIAFISMVQGSYYFLKLWWKTKGIIEKILECIGIRTLTLGHHHHGSVFRGDISTVCETHQY